MNHNASKPPNREMGQRVSDRSSAITNRQSEIFCFLILHFSLPFPALEGKLPCSMSGRSVAWLARLFRVQEVVSSNLTAPTIQSTLKTLVITMFLATMPRAVRHTCPMAGGIDVSPGSFQPGANLILNALINTVL